jgi:hypothetical protein
VSDTEPTLMSIIQTAWYSLYNASRVLSPAAGRLARSPVHLWQRRRCGRVRSAYLWRCSISANAGLRPRRCIQYSIVAGMINSCALPWVAPSQDLVLLLFFEDSSTDYGLASCWADCCSHLWVETAYGCVALEHGTYGAFSVWWETTEV